MKNINTNKLFTLILLFTYSSITFAQKSTDKNLIYWSATKKLTVDDFGIKISGKEVSSAQFSTEYHINGFNFLTKNFNKKVLNYMIKSASQIDTTANVKESLIFQQTLFDLCEIYTREFRKALRDNRKTIISGTEIVKELDHQLITKLVNRKSEYTLDTNSGCNPIKQKEWETQIAKELEELKDFAYEK